MHGFLLLWLGSSLLVLAAVYLVRSLRAQHVARLRELRWRGVIVLALALGIVPALLADLLSSRQVTLPTELSQRPDLGPPRSR